MGLNRKHTALIAILLIIIVLFTSVFLTLKPSNDQTPLEKFYVGVEYAYGNQPSQVKLLVDQVKNYTNLLVLGSEITFNRTALDEACGYVITANLSLIVQFTGLEKYSYDTRNWMLQAQQKYGDKFLGVYRYDEPGGNQLDQGQSLIVNRTEVNANSSYTDIANKFNTVLSIFPSGYLPYSPRVYTADYGLYWFDYKAGYTTIFAEFVGNESRERHIALCRGAAEAFGNDWGAIVTWKYTDGPDYLESPDELYNDLTLAYTAGAKYTIVFSYPNATDANYGILTMQHLEKMQQFWNYTQSNPASFGSTKPSIAYIVPADYGFGFRSANDTIWGVFPPDQLSPKIYNDVTTLTETYGSQLDILYDGPKTATLLPCYSKVFYWNQTVT